jgi:multiple antibiotic resistance protein
MTLEGLCYLTPGMPLEFLISALVTLLVVVDPIGLVPSYLAVTGGLPRRARRSVALRAAMIAAAILAGSALIGDWLLRTLSIGLPAFRIAGGLLLFSIASEMVFGVRIERQSRQAEDAIEEHVRNVAAFPLAIPLMAGPGAITATVLLAGRSEGDPMRLAILLAVIAFVATLCAAVFLLCTPIGRLLGVTGNIVLSRLLGVLLAALAVQFVVDGVRAVLV